VSHWSITAPYTWHAAAFAVAAGAAADVAPQQLSRSVAIRFYTNCDAAIK